MIAPAGRVELANIVRAHAGQLIGCSPTQRHVLQAIADCRTAALGAQIAFTAILHTWTQLLLLHPHLHCIVPAGGLDPGHTHWISTRADFFLPVRVLAEVFRGKLLAALEKAIDRVEIPPGPHAADLHVLLKRAAEQRWVVYCKPPFAGPEQMLAYLARYTHRIALSNDRLVSLHEGQVTFCWKDRAHGNASRVTTVAAEAFLRRFLFHVLPPRFVRIRHDGWPTPRANASCPRSRRWPPATSNLCAPPCPTAR